MADTLTAKQSRFTSEYLANGGNGTKAAEAAGYAGSYGTLRSVASENLRKPEIDMHIRARLAAQNVTPDRIIERLAEIAFLPLDDPLVTITEFDRNGNVKSTRYDHTQINRAAETLSKILGMQRDKLDITTDGPIRTLIYAPPRALLQARIAQEHLEAGSGEETLEQTEEEKIGR